MVKLYTETQRHSLPGSALKVCVGGGGGWWWWVESEFSDRLWLSFSLALASQTIRIRENNSYNCSHYVLPALPIGSAGICLDQNDMQDKLLID